MITNNHYAMVFDISVIRNKILEQHRLPENELNELIKVIYQYFLLKYHKEYYINEIRYRDFPVECSSIYIRLTHPMFEYEKERIDIAGDIIKECLAILEDQLVLLYDTVNVGQSILRGIDILNFDIHLETLLIHYILI